MNFGVILYTFYNDVKDVDQLKKVLPEIRKMGYKGVEFAGFYGSDPVTLRELCEINGLEILGAHMSVNDLLPKNIDSTIAFAKGLGLTQIGVGSGPHGSLDDTIHTALIMEWANKYGKDKGLKFYYHTHHREFKKLETGEYPIDILKEATYLQIDTYWSHYAKIDTCAFLRENKDRIISLHIKDGIGRQTKALGEGDNNLNEIIETAKEIGMNWMIVENDLPEPNGMEDISRSMKWLKDNGHI